MLRFLYYQMFARYLALLYTVKNHCNCAWMYKGETAKITAYPSQWQDLRGHLTLKLNGNAASRKIYQFIILFREFVCGVCCRCCCVRVCCCCCWWWWCVCVCFFFFFFWGGGGGVTLQVATDSKKPFEKQWIRHMPQKPHVLHHTIDHYNVNLLPAFIVTGILRL